MDLSLTDEHADSAVEIEALRWRVLRIYDGTDEIQRRTIARNLLAGHASVRGHLG